MMKLSLNVLLSRTVRDKRILIICLSHDTIDKPVTMFVGDLHLYEIANLIALFLSSHVVALIAKMISLVSK